MLTEQERQALRPVSAVGGPSPAPVALVHGATVALPGTQVSLCDQRVWWQTQVANPSFTPRGSYASQPHFPLSHGPFRVAIFALARSALVCGAAVVVTSTP